MENVETRSRIKKGRFLVEGFFPDKFPGPPAYKTSTSPRSNLGQTHFRLVWGGGLSPSTHPVYLSGPGLVCSGLVLSTPSVCLSVRLSVCLFVWPSVLPPHPSPPRPPAQTSLKYVFRKSELWACRWFISW